MDWKAFSIKAATPQKATYRFNTVPIKIPEVLFTDTEEQRHTNNQMTPQKSQMRSLTLTDF